MKQKVYEYIGECKGNDGNGCFMDSSGHDCGCFVRKLKQETVEQAAERLYTTIHEQYQYDAFIEGAKWQQERSYSEEEVLDILYKHTEDLLAGKKVTLEEWFEQFKNK